MPDQTKYTGRLVNKRILIIGGSSGIGFGVAEAAIEHGAQVVISSSNPSRIEDAVERIKKAYPSKTANISGLTVNLAQPDTIEAELTKLFDGAVEKIGRDGKLDHVVYTAGDSLLMVSLADITYDKILKGGQIRFIAPLLIGKYIQKYVHKTRFSSYTITSGGIADRPRATWSIIGSFAGGHGAMVRQLALELKPVRVNGVSPGPVDTELWKMPEEQKKGFFKVMEGQLPVANVAGVEDVAQTYMAVLKDANVDAEILRSDGGALAS